jgi:predicted GTPase
VVFVYSDVAHEQVMHLASRALARGAGFRLLAPRETMLQSSRPVVSVCAVRTGCGKSPASRAIAAVFAAASLGVAVVRHPMPYGDLARQVVQRFARLEDLDAAECTVEEREEYEPHLRAGHLVFAGVDYERILRQAEAEADVVLWDGGNNDLPFFQPDLEIVLADPHRRGHERSYFPGEVNLLRADVVVLSKVDTARFEDVAALRASVAAANPRAIMVEADMPVSVDRPELIEGARVLVVEDGPTVTHGGMPYGAGVLAAQRLGATELVDPRPLAAGSLRRVFAEHPHIGRLLPAMGYGEEQLSELAETINRADCDAVLVATPVDLQRLFRIRQPVVRASYSFRLRGDPTLEMLLAPIIRKARG